MTRTLDPHGVVLKAGTWYVVARSGEDMRTYRVSQITKLTVLDERFVRLQEFDLARYWDAYLIEFGARLYTSDATVRMSKDGRVRIRELMDAAVARAVESTASAPDPDGWITAVVPIESLDHAHTEFLKFGAELEVLQPPELRSLLNDSASALADLYGSRKRALRLHESRGDHLHAKSTSRGASEEANPSLPPPSDCLTLRCSQS